MSPSSPCSTRTKRASCGSTGDGAACATAPRSGPRSARTPTRSPGRSWSRCARRRSRRWPTGCGPSGTSGLIIIATSVPVDLDVDLLVTEGELIRAARLALRVRQASANALALARFLEAHPKVERVLYPGLPSHPRHDLAIRQMEGGCGGLLSFQVQGDAAAALAVAGRLRLIARDLARRHRKRDRAPVHDRRRGDRRAAQPAPPRGRHRGQGRPDRRSRPGARRHELMRNEARPNKR